MTTTWLLRDVRPFGDVRIHDGRIVEIGQDLVGAGETVLDGRGRLLLPGLRDAHVHFTEWAMRRRNVARDDALADATTAYAAAHTLTTGVAPDEDWVRGGGFRQATWPLEPHRDLLDEVLPGRKVVLSSQDVHSSWWSTAALDALGIDHPTGFLRERESWDAIARIPDLPDDVVDAAIAEAAAEAAARGITQIVDYEMAGSRAGWQRRSAAGPLPFRVVSSVVRSGLDEAIDARLATGAVLSPLLTVGALKLFTDGALGSRSAWCDHSYPGEPENHGMQLSSRDELAHLIGQAASAGIATTVHAIGDAANREALDAFAQAGVGGRIEHAQLLDPGDLARFRALGVTASVQPGHATDDRDLAEHWWADRLDRAYPLASLVTAGAQLRFGSDAPVAPLDPWRTLAAAVARTTDDLPPWLPAQAVDLDTALRASTAGPIHVGGPADLVLVENLDAADLGSTAVGMTMVAGRITHRT